MACSSAGMIGGGTLPRPNATSARPRSAVVQQHADQPVAHSGVDLQQLDAGLESPDAQTGARRPSPRQAGRAQRRPAKQDAAGVDDAERTELGRRERAGRLRVHLPDLARRQDLLVHDDQHAVAACGGRRRDAGGREHIRRGRPSSGSETVRIAPTSTTGFGDISTRSSRNAVSSIVSVPCVMTRPSTSGRSSQAAARRASRHICSGVTCGPGSRENSSISIVADAIAAREPARGSRPR